MLSIDASAIVIFAIVWVLVLVLGKIFFKPITRILDARAGRIARDQAAASEALEAYGRGRITYRSGSFEGSFAVRGGYAQVQPEKVLIMTESDEDEGSGPASA